MAKKTEHNTLEKLSEVIPVKKNKRLRWIIWISVILIVLFVAYRVWINIHFLITDDLVVNLDPNQKSLAIHYDENPNLTFSVNVENSIFCRTYCSYEFNDLSTNTLIANGTFTGKSLSKEFGLSVDRIGSGQKIYTFDVACNNIRTWSCPTNGVKRERSSFVTLNYDLSEYERALKETLRDNITQLVNELSVIDIEIQKLNDRFFELGFKINLNEIEDDKDILNNDYNAIVLEFENLGRVWSEENYIYISELFNKSYDSRILKIKEDISGMNIKIDRMLERHNSIVRQLNGLDNSLRSMNETVLFLDRLNRVYMHRELLNKVRVLKLQAAQNTFANYTYLESQIYQAEQLSLSLENSSKKIFMNAYLYGAYSLEKEKEILCAIKGICMGKTNFSYILETSADVDDNKIGAFCSSFGMIQKNYERENNISQGLLKDYDLGKINIVLDNTKNKKVLEVKKNIFNEINGTNTTGGLNRAKDILLNLSRIDSNISEEISYGNLSENEALSLIQINLSEDALQYQENYCRVIRTLNLSDYFGAEAEIDEVDDMPPGNFSSRIDIKLTENYPICCIFGGCEKCCTEEECSSNPKLYPVLFLHGHTLHSDNTPDFSLDAFNRIQSKLQEDGYVIAGTITPLSDYSEISGGEWGLSSKPISVKGSYYLVSYYNLGDYSIAAQKSENIETYAIRLKEMVDLLKFRTGRDKVIIIAHSMGGLVARSYMQVFGDGSVYKLIMLDTPNKGVSGRVSSFCPVLGENKECEDMSEDSIFMKKLNDPKKIPENADIYTIVGIGCDMGNGKTGDGIVVKENQELDYAKNYYINGTCSGLSTFLHNEILDIEEYPEVYGIIRSILKES
jgi:hypothetical protein